MMRKKRQKEDDPSVLPVGLWEYLQPYVAEEAPPSLEWAVRRPLEVDDERSTRPRVVPAPAPAT